MTGYEAHAESGLFRRGMDDIVVNKQRPEKFGMSKKLFVLLVCLGCLLSACSTVEGAGQDISDTARWIKNRL
jgi:predicted small secreted protein